MYYYSNTKDVASGTKTACPSGAPEFTPCFSEVCVARSLVFCVFSPFVLFLLAICIVYSSSICVS